MVGRDAWAMSNAMGAVLAKNLVRSRLSEPGQLKRPAGNHDVSHSELEKRWSFLFSLSLELPWPLLESSVPSLGAAARD